ncbi:MAG: YceH family protein [Elusimicrobia bacterium]|nr:YceH family protein [Elusimicrobiota bacterium]
MLGSLVEKSLTTPEQYPLSLNALLSACNQKTSREPVMSLGEEDLRRELFTVLEKKLAVRITEQGSRVPKFGHCVENLVGATDPKLVGAVCILLLRGPQTPGEIKTRTDRLCEFASTAEVEALLQDLSARPEPLVAKLPRQPGQKESRYQHLFSGAVRSAPPAPSCPPAAPDRLSQLEKKVEGLERRLKEVEDRAAQPR